MEYFVQSFEGMENRPKMLFINIHLITKMKAIFMLYRAVIRLTVFEAYIIFILSTYCS